ncbi:hypothetical protein F7P66_02860 [Campylobacter hyointestinalis subsp. lawsonii]|uniref:D-glucuronyl C5-epimerase C-terminal domain-containing protein n=1 Tax=Campylobacter hyointestinalis subsp. lawsonii TaxID=91353 RepID=A0AAV6EG81_CAMHY|nr:hypothetical protein F7P66_02860 [Campylobacter hyointestinalis subsp. lawsonii]QKF68697.1 D-glucuronyl C5-epimerase C-terminus family protein [Campylobacter hyointestinalis subsp. lawsonii]RAZ28567.1 hypothetical protein CHLT_04170 [Campylobacter hyointestinalis subsp. lawsonii]
MYDVDCGGRLIILIKYRYADSYKTCFARERVDTQKLNFCQKNEILELKDRYFIDINNNKYLYYYIPISKNVYDYKKSDMLGIDDNNIVYVNYKEPIGIQYNPLTIAQYALTNFNKYIDTNDTIYKDNFFNQVDYLVNNYDNIDNSNIGWPYMFEWKYYDLDAGWYSGLAQGQITSVLVRAYLITNNKEYLPIISKAINFMLKEINENEKGLLRYTPEGYVWIEEYPSKKPSLVLNGFVSSIVGLYDYSILFPNDEVRKKIYNQLIVSLKHSINFYDTGDWLLYDRYRINRINNNYMEFQTNQMLQMYINTNDDFFSDLYKKYANYSINNYEYSIYKAIESIYIKLFYWFKN